MSAEKSVFNYLLSQNRPYSVNDILQNLHKEHGKTGIVKALEKLVEEGKVIEKAYGKQKIFYVNQSELEEVSCDEIKKMDTIISEKENKLKELEKILKDSQNQIKKMTQTLPISILKQQTVDMESECEVLEEKLRSLGKITVLVSEADRSKTKRHLEKCYYAWRAKKRICTDILNMMLEDSPKSKADLFGEIGICTDEEEGVTLPNF